MNDQKVTVIFGSWAYQKTLLIAEYYGDSEEKWSGN